MKNQLSKFKLLAVLLLIISVLTYSCGDPEENEKPYVPAQKISKIYNGTKDNPTDCLYQGCAWETDGLSRIYDYLCTIYTLRTTSYFYENNKLIKIVPGGGYYSISYDKNDIKTMVYYKNGNDTPQLTWDFYYSNKKVSKIICRFDAVYLSGSLAKESYLSSLLSNEIISHLEKLSKSKSDMVATINYKYKGDNISEISVDVNSELNYRVAYKSYDKMNNPFYKQLRFESTKPSFIDEFVTSKNNYLEVEVYVDNVLSASNKVSYRYRNDFPIDKEVVGNDYYTFNYYEYE